MKTRSRVKSSFVAGLILIAPLVVTVFVLRILIGWTQQFVDPVVAGTRLTQYTGNNELVAQLAAVILILGAITLLGYLAQRSIGRQVFGNMGRIVNVIPLISTLYVSVRQVSNSLVERRTAYDGVALVEYPREDMYYLGLITGKSPTVVEEATEETMYNVFLPNSPNPTGGRLLLLPERQVHEIDMSVRRGMQLIVTSGIGADQGSSYDADAAFKHGYSD
ncbi:putative membrane protein [Halanaeroarchaeum sp. HSR-CO]|uniref:DUF502 domain-containing protein n=1 Tax=Halanaeroarchaeum sp. HSR-CO TaxID=2866382 RepID=UPI00217CFA31|nr:DUF502 domain-containing protein [Halanaeroarchaeum sp. HSR-CO]UWG47995.1 putative membrane protein [Halanaeroarchaeum sp. HSR-CO]